jgi:hypothetical protein
MIKFDPADPIWRILAAIDTEPTGEFRNLVEAAKLNPKTDFRNAYLTGLPLKEPTSQNSTFLEATFAGPVCATPKDLMAPSSRAKRSSIQPTGNGGAAASRQLGIT